MGARENIVRALIKLYHGSPHSFDKFDPKKIGTGESGAMSGRGVNLTSSPAEAELYRTGGQTRWGVGGDAKFSGPGHAYEVNLNAAPHELADLTLPLNKQPQNVQDAMRQWSATTDNGDARRLGFYVGPGRDVEGALAGAGYKGFTNKVGGNDHYTVWDTDALNIARKYGIGGAAAVPAIGAAFDQSQYGATP